MGDDALLNEIKGLRGDIRDLENTISKMSAYQNTHYKRIEDHETRIRKNESVIGFVTGFFSIASVIFGAVLTWATNKLLNGGQ